MYETFYQFKKSPFRVNPDPAFMYVSPSQREAMASVVFGVQRRKGFIVVVGEAGVGKTAILRRYLARADAKRLTTAFVCNANVGFKDLLGTICQELGVTNEPADVAGMVNRLHQTAIEEYRQHRNVVVVVDEAQNMPSETLENLRVLSNLNTSTDNLIQIVLVGQPELADKLNRHELRQLKQRVAVRCTLEPYTEAESQDYLEHRLRAAGSSTASVFTQAALRAIIDYGMGIPRRLNILSDAALVTGLGCRAKPVTAPIVTEVICDLEGKPRVVRRPKVRASLAAVIVMSTALCGAVFLEFLQGDSRVEANRVATSAEPAQPEAEPASGPPSVPPPGDDAPRPPSMNTGALPPAAQPLVATRVVGRGDTLLRLTLDVYGFPLDAVFQRVLEENPSISDVNWIRPGTTIRFPDVSDLRARRPKSIAGGQLKP